MRSTHCYLFILALLLLSSVSQGVVVDIHVDGINSVKQKHREGVTLGLTGRRVPILCVVLPTPASGSTITLSSIHKPRSTGEIALYYTERARKPIQLPLQITPNQLPLRLYAEGIAMSAEPFDVGLSLVYTDSKTKKKYSDTVRFTVESSDPPRKQSAANRMGTPQVLLARGSGDTLRTVIYVYDSRLSPPTVCRCGDTPYIAV